MKLGYLEISIKWNKPKVKKPYRPWCADCDKHHDSTYWTRSNGHKCAMCMVKYLALPYEAKRNKGYYSYRFNRYAGLSINDMIARGMSELEALCKVMLIDEHGEYNEPITEIYVGEEIDGESY